MSNIEQRTSTRRSLWVPAVVELPQGAMQARTVDVSTGGMGIVIKANLPPESLFKIHLRLPAEGGSSLLAAQVQVTHTVYSAQSGGYRLGLRFTELAHDMRAAIETYVDAMSEVPA